MSDFQAAKIKLIMDLRRAGIGDIATLNAIERTPREVFTPDAFRDHAYANRPLPIQSGQTISQPYIVAYMTEMLELDSRCRVLEIGTGSGYQTAVLAQICRRVYTVERFRNLRVESESRFRALDFHRITSMLGDGTRGWPEQAPFDRIIVTAAAAEAPPALLNQLIDGGVMIMPVGPPDGEQHLVRFRRAGDEFTREELLAVRFVPLVSAEEANQEAAPATSAEGALR